MSKSLAVFLVFACLTAAVAIMSSARGQTLKAPEAENKTRTKIVNPQAILNDSQLIKSQASAELLKRPSSSAMASNTAPPAKKE